MAQKDKIKELVGRSLNSYHTKSLQQIDRIEKKNKEQNHKISILSNELDNDYLTKTEEGSVVSLEHSKEGMVYLDELQGNTLVNYCTDGSKEMTLNGDIDVEGTFITTTEGVDNGKVDVMCEGNTLVNLVNKIQDYKGNAGLYGWQNKPSNCEKYEWVDNGVKIYSTLQDTSTDRYFRSTPYENGIFKPNRTYIVRMNVSASDLNVSASILRCFYGKGKVFMSGSLQDVENGVFVKKATTFSDLNVPHSMISLDYIRPLNTEGWVSFQNVMVIDVTDLPSYQQDIEYWRNIEYFEGMKSVGQDDENGHKIEILSTTNNLLDLSLIDGLAEEGDKIVAKKIINSSNSSLRLKPNTRYKVTMEKYDSNSAWIGFGYRINGTYTFINNTNNKDNRVVEFTTPNERDIIFYAGANGPNDIGHYLRLIKLEYANSSSNSSIAKHNKKEILLNEPLGGLPNGVKDRIVKIGGKYFIERKIRNYVIDGTESWNLDSGREMENTKYFRTSKFAITDYHTNSYNGKVDFFLNDRYTQTSASKNWEKNSDTPSLDVNKDLTISIRDTAQTIEEFKQKLSNNPINLIFEVKPTYEPLEIEPTLNTYNDITHISNNSIIPCNMKIQNSGYNAIIKPSTLYTIALDTNKSGTIGMNLGGAKGTTTNNVLKLTTPATLTDDSLRLYGKGIKGSKVRLLEGDKTNWIPSFFEGMKSSFEDKLQDNGSYKMEILMNNENLFDITKLQDDSTEHHIARKNNANGFTLTRKNTGSGWNYSTWELPFKLKANTKYTISCKINKSNINSKPCCRLFDFTLQKDYAMLYSSGKYEFTTPINGYERIKLLLYSSIDNVTINEGDTVDFNDIKISEVKNGDFVNHQSNKIQFLLDEPLRSLPNNVRDEITFKDNKLMIERNIGVKRLTSEDVTGYGATNSSNSNTKPNVKIIQFRLQNLKPSWGGLTTLCNKLKTGKIGKGDQTSIEHLYWGTEYNWIGCNNTSEPYVGMTIDKTLLSSDNIAGARQYIDNENIELIYQLAESTYEEVPHELQKIILEGYENGTLFFDTNIPPTSTVRYAGETPIVKVTKLNKTEVLNNTNDINDNIIPYLMDMDYRVVCLQLQSEEFNGGVTMARLFGGAYEMLQRDIQSKRYSVDEYRHRLDAYLSANKITEEEYNKLGDMLNE